jgi:hypothetical protein
VLSISYLLNLHLIFRQVHTVGPNQTNLTVSTLHLALHTNNSVTVLLFPSWSSYIMVDFYIFLNGISIMLSIKRFE